MSSSSSSRNNSTIARGRARSPSLGQEQQAEANRNRAKLAGWSVGAVGAGAVLLKLIVLTARDFFAMLDAPLIGDVGGAKGAVQPVMLFANAPTIIAQKVEPYLSEVADSMQRWQVADDELHRTADAADSAVVRAAELLEVVDSLQQKLAKSRSTGSAAGVNTHVLNGRLTELKTSHAAVMQQMIDAGNRMNKHEKYFKASSEDEMGPYAEDPEYSTMENLREFEAYWQESLKNRVSDFTKTFSYEQFRGELDYATAAWLADAVSTDEAEQMAGEIVAEARAEAANVDSAQLISDETLLYIAREEVSSVEVPVPPIPGCVSRGKATEMAKMALERYGADSTGQPDYATALAGGNVVKAMTSDTYKPKDKISVVEQFKNIARNAGGQSINGPIAAISPPSSVGKCWAMKGSRGRLTVMLYETRALGSVSIEHLSRSILLNGGFSAPKEISVIGYRMGWTPGSSTVGDVLVSRATYHLEDDVIQFFPIDEQFRGVNYSAVTLNVESNHGEPAYTCIYRFRVHGI